VNGMQLGKGRIICERLTPLFMKNGRSFKYQDKISIRGKAVTPYVLSLHVHLHCMKYEHVHSVGYQNQGYPNPTNKNNQPLRNPHPKNSSKIESRLHYAETTSQTRIRKKRGHPRLRSDSLEAHSTGSLDSGKSLTSMTQGRAGRPPSLIHLLTDKSI
jgi:hypothetical protein